MTRFVSLRARLSLVGLLLFALNAGLGVVTIHLFNGFNELSDELRVRWLPATRLLGDLNNFSSDYRTAEGDCLLTTDPVERATRLRVVAELGRAVARAQRDYERIGDGGGPEAPLYAAFAARWQAYLLQAAKVLALASAGQQAEAVNAYRTTSRAEYDAASDTLGLLTARNVERARQASARTAAAYLEGRVMIGIALLVTGAMLAAALAYVRRRISSPLIEMAGTMRQLATNTTDIKVDGLDRADEIGEMARAVMVFRANAIELIQSQEGLAQQAAMLEQKLAYEQHLTHMQRNFVAMISHEFRTPLGAIDAHAQRLINMKDHIAAADLAERAGRIRSAVQRITGLMEHLLESSRLMDGEARLFFHPAALDLAALIKDVCCFHRETAPNADIDITFDACPLPITGDPKLLFQAFSNLLSNAIKYSPGDAVIRITTRRCADTTIVAIRDQGLGIALADQANLFTRYYRGSNVSGIVGTGIGLYLARTVVHLHGGEIAVQSRQGRGACFTVTLPNRGPVSGQGQMLPG